MYILCSHYMVASVYICLLTSFLLQLWVNSVQQIAVNRGNLFSVVSISGFERAQPSTSPDNRRELLLFLLISAAVWVSGEASRLPGKVVLTASWREKDAWQLLPTSCSLTCQPVGGVASPPCPLDFLEVALTTHWSQQPTVEML